MPVLSEHIHDVEPKVSIDSKFLTRINLFSILLADRISDTVIAASNPSGIFATIIPITNYKFVIISYS